MRVIVSAGGLREGGGWSVVEDCISSLEKKFSKDADFILYLSDAGPQISLTNFQVKRIKILQLGWIGRFIFDFVMSPLISLYWKPDIWISLHDITPFIFCKRKIVYFHNPAPFYKTSKNLSDIDFHFFIFKKIYSLFVVPRLKKSDIVICQQNWIKTELNKIVKGLNIIVAKPDLPKKFNGTLNYFPSTKLFKKYGQTTIFYPSLPRFFKKFETVCDAVIILMNTYDIRVNLLITLKGNENAYARKLKKKYERYKNISFIGVIDRLCVLKIMKKADLLVFPSELETFGMPLLEAIALKKNILVSDLPYAYETIGNYKYVKFAEPSKPEVWAKNIADFIKYRTFYNDVKNNSYHDIEGWKELWDIIISKKVKKNQK